MNRSRSAVREHSAKLTGVDKKDLVAPIAQFGVAGDAIGLVAGKKPKASRDLSRIKKLAQQRDHAVDDAGLAIFPLYQRLADRNLHRSGSMT